MPACLIASRFLVPSTCLSRCHARIANIGSGCGSRDCAGTKASRRRRTTSATPAATSGRNSSRSPPSPPASAPSAGRKKPAVGSVPGPGSSSRARDSIRPITAVTRTKRAPTLRSRQRLHPHQAVNQNPRARFS